MESIRGEGGSIPKGNQDDNHYKLKEKDDKITTLEAEKMDLQTKLHESEEQMKTSENDHEIMQQKSSEDLEEFRIAMKEKNELLMVHGDEIEERENIISDKDKEILRLHNEVQYLKKLLRDKILEIKQINIKLSNKYTKCTESLLNNLQKIKDEVKCTEKRIKELKALEIFHKASIEGLEEDNENLKRGLEVKDTLMRDTSAEYQNEIKENLDEIQELKRITEKEIKELTRTVNYFKHELEKTKQTNKEILDKQKYKTYLLQLSFIILLSLSTLIYPMSSYSWYHPVTFIIMTAIIVMIIKLLWYDK